MFKFSLKKFEKTESGQSIGLTNRGLYILRLTSTKALGYWTWPISGFSFLGLTNRVLYRDFQNGKRKNCPVSFIHLPFSWTRFLFVRESIFSVFFVKRNCFQTFNLITCQTNCGNSSESLFQWASMSFVEILEGEKAMTTLGLINCCVNKKILLLNILF